MRTIPRGFTVGTLVILLCVSSTAFAGGYNLAGVGAKALSMGGAFRAISDDWSAMYWNPAGLAGQESGVFLEAKVLYPMVWVTPNVPVPYEGYWYDNGTEITTRAKAFPAGAFAIQYMMNEKMTVGLGIFAPSAIGADWERLFKGPPYGYNNQVAWPEQSWMSDMKVIDIHPTAGYQVNDQLKVGFGISVFYALFELGGPKITPSGAIFPVEHIYSNTLLEGTGMGFGFNVGAIYDVSEQLHLGASFHGPATIPMSGTMTIDTYLPQNDGLYEYFMASGDTTTAMMFTGARPSSEADAEADFPIPMDFGFGVAYDVSDRLTIAGDFVWTNWATAGTIDIVLDGNDPLGLPLDDSELLLEWEDTFRFSGGMNYVILPDKGLEGRLGFYYDPSPIPDETLAPRITDVAAKTNLSIGFGYPISENMMLEGYWEHVISGERTVSAGDINNDGEIDNIAGDWKMQVDTFGFQLAFRF